MRTALLRGRDHHTIGMVDVVGDAWAAAAISIGGAPKRYAHTDPNEDAAGYCVADAGTVLVVGDAHDGFEASEVLADHLLTHPAPQWCDAGLGIDAARWSRHVIAALCDANEDALRESRDRGGFESSSTLTLALVRPDLGRLAYASVGDSLLLVVDADGTREVGNASGGPGHDTFLGRRSIAPDVLARRVRTGVLTLEGVEGVVAATDGLSERGIGCEDPAAATARAADAARGATAPVRAMTFARAVAEEALAAQRTHGAGDNIGVAACWLP